jgi:hypothetical protein
MALGCTVLEATCIKRLIAGNGKNTPQPPHTPAAACDSDDYRYIPITVYTHQHVGHELPARREAAADVNKKNKTNAVLAMHLRT